MRELILDPDWSQGRRIGLERAIRDVVRSGQLQAGSILPSTRALAADLGIARATVVGAYEQLIAEGYLVGQPGVGTIVAKIHNPEPISQSKKPTKPKWDIDFLPGEPDGGLFPRTAWLRSLKRVLSEVPDSEFGYCSPRGHYELRSELSLYLARSRAVLAAPETINIVGGTTAAVALLSQMFAELGMASIAVEDPSLPMLHYGMKLGGSRLVPVPVDSEGLCVDRLWDTEASAVLVTPSHQFPMGVAMSAARRAQLVEWAQSRRAWIIEDDYDGEFRYDRQPLGALQGLEPERTIYLGTASKALAPGLRMAWIALPAALQTTFTAVRGMQSVTSTIDQLALADFIKRGEVDRHLRRTRTVYHRRQQALLGVIETDVGWLNVAGVDAGLHLTGTINTSSGSISSATEARVTEAGVIAALAEESMRAVGLSAHFQDESNSQEGLVLGYSRIPEHSFSGAVERLCEVLSRQ
nr:hypothetical protein [uncultured bacterium]